MGYSTEFEGVVGIDPPLNGHEIAYLRKFSETRRMLRDLGPYFADGSGLRGQGDDSDIRDFNSPPPDQPSLWCDLVPTEDGTGIEWNGGEKFHSAEIWMAYLIDTFLKAGATVQGELANPVAGRHYSPAFEHFTFDHVANGVMDAQGEDPEDRWRLVVTANVVTVQKARIVWDDDES
jgi:hypothetical protein